MEKATPCSTEVNEAVGDTGKDSQPEISKLKQYMEKDIKCGTKDAAGSLTTSILNIFLPTKCSTAPRHITSHTVEAKIIIAAVIQPFRLKHVKSLLSTNSADLHNNAKGSRSFSPGAFSQLVKSQLNHNGELPLWQ